MWNAVGIYNLAIDLALGSSLVKLIPIFQRLALRFLFISSRTSPVNGTYSNHRVNTVTSPPSVYLPLTGKPAHEQDLSLLRSTVA